MHEAKFWIFLVVSLSPVVIPLEVLFYQLITNFLTWEIQFCCFRRYPQGCYVFRETKPKYWGIIKVFIMWHLEKNLKNISSNVKCGCKDWGQGRGNMEKSSFAFKRNAIKRSKFHVYFLLLDLFNVWFDSQL